MVLLLLHVLCRQQSVGAVQVLTGQGGSVSGRCCCAPVLSQQGAVGGAQKQQQWQHRTCPAVMARLPLLSPLSLPVTAAAPPAAVGVAGAAVGAAALPSSHPHPCCCRTCPWLDLSSRMPRLPAAEQAWPGLAGSRWCCQQEHPHGTTWGSGASGCASCALHWWWCPERPCLRHHRHIHTQTYMLHM